MFLLTLKSCHPLPHQGNVLLYVSSKFSRVVNKRKAYDTDVSLVKFKEVSTNWKSFCRCCVLFFYSVLSFVVRNEGNQSLVTKEGENSWTVDLLSFFHWRHTTNDERHTTGTRLMTRQTMRTIMLSKMAKKGKERKKMCSRNKLEENVGE